VIFYVICSVGEQVAKLTDTCLRAGRGPAWEPH